jgi:hypothetical protein
VSVVQGRKSYHMESTSSSGDPGPGRKRSRIDGQEEAQRPSRACCSCKNTCETGKDCNWLNMGPPQTDTWQFWNSIDFNLYIDWEQQVSGDYGTYLPFCKYCMSTIRSTIQRNHAASGATAVAISMLAEQIYFKVHEIMVAEVSEHTYQT